MNQNDSKVFRLACFKYLNKLNVCVCVSMSDEFACNTSKFNEIGFVSNSMATGTHSWVDSYIKRFGCRPNAQHYNITICYSFFY